MEELKMKIIEKGKKTSIRFKSLFYNDVFRSKNSGDIYIRIPHTVDIYHDDFNAWGLTSETFAFFDAEEEVELLEAELHINN